MYINVDNIPDMLKGLKQWVLWKKVTVREKEKKVPYAITGQEASVIDVSTWGNFGDIINTYSRNSSEYSGIGFVFSKNDPFVGVDFDDCIVDGKITPSVEEWVNRFASYTEVSQSSTGIHIICQGNLPVSGKRKDDIEMYQQSRYFVVTGNTIGNFTSITNSQDAVMNLYTSVFAPVKKELAKPAINQQPIQELTGSGSYSIIRQCMNAANGHKFYKLFHDGDYSEYPSQSEADLALCSLIAFYTRSEDLIDAIFRQGKLYREKWERSEYREKTINTAISNLTCTYEPNIAHKEQVKHKLPETKKASDLQQRRFAETRFVVPGIIPEGLTIIAGRPKIRKSFLALNLATAIAIGGMALGSIPVEKGKVLYVALEDGEKRLQQRLNTIMQGYPLPDTFEYWETMEKIESGGLDQLQEYVRLNPDIRLIIIDPFAGIKNIKTKGNCYETDYDLVSKLQRFVKNNNLAVIIITHTRKALSNDYIDDITGSLGIAGAIDTAILLKRSRGDNEGILQITGRDVLEGELAIRFNTVNTTWELMGDAKLYKQSRERQDIINVLLQRNVPMKDKDLANALDKNYNSVRKLTSDMADAGILARVDRGTYAIAQSYLSYSNQHSGGGYSNYGGNSTPPTCVYYNNSNSSSIGISSSSSSIGSSRYEYDDEYYDI